MQDLKSKIQNLTSEFESELKMVSNLRSLEELRIKFLGKKSMVTDLLGQIKNFSVEEKKNSDHLLTSLK